MTRQAAAPEIHEQERHVVQHVRAGDPIVEFDAVEQRRPALEQYDVAQVQVAVALPYEPRCTTLVQYASARVEFGARGVCHLATRRGIQDARTVGGTPFGVAVDDPRD